MKKTTKKHYLTLTEADNLLLDSYCNLISCLSLYLGDAYELVVHSFGLGDHFIRKLIKGSFASRVIEDPLIPEGAHPSIEQLDLRLKHGEEPIIVSFSVGPDGRKYKSCSIGIVNEQRLIGMICINYCLDVPFSDVIRSFTLPNHLDDPALALQVPDNGHYTAALVQSITKVRDSVMSDSDIPSKFKRKEIVRRLNDSGVFKVKNAIQVCADTLGITIATIYMHIRNLESE